MIFIWHTGKDGLWMHGLDAWTLDASMFGLWTTGRVDSGRLDACTLDEWTLGLWTTRRLDSGRLGPWTLDA